MALRVANAKQVERLTDTIRVEVVENDTNPGVVVAYRLVVNSGAPINLNIVQFDLLRNLL